MVSITYDQLKELIRYVWKKHPYVTHIHIKQSKVEVRGLLEMNHWKVLLPEKEEGLHERLTKKSAYNLRRERKLIQDKLGDITIENYCSNNCPNEYIEAYFRWKKEQMKVDYQMSPQEYLDKYFVTDVYCLFASKELISILFTCEQGEKVYLENLSYNTVYRNYSPGTVLYDEVLRILINKNKKALYLGDGKQFYKTRYSAIEENNTYSGVLVRRNLKQKIVDRTKNAWRVFSESNVIEFMPESSDKVLIVAPHPDDESLGCGQIICQYGTQVSVLLMTNGNLGIPQLSKEKTVQIRNMEFGNAIKCGRITEAIKLNIDDTMIKITDFIKVIKHVNLREYDYVFIPGRNDNHHDHKKTNLIFRLLYASNCIKGKLMEYEVWTPLSEYNYVLKFQDYNDKSNLIENYVSQIEVVDYPNMMHGLNKFRGIVNGSGFAECYYGKDKIKKRIINAIKYMLKGKYNG